MSHEIIRVTAHTPIGVFVSEVRSDDKKEINSLLAFAKNINNVESATFPCSNDQEKKFLLPQQVIQTSVFVFEAITVDDKDS